MSSHVLFCQQITGCHFQFNTICYLRTINVLSYEHLRSFTDSIDLYSLSEFVHVLLKCLCVRLVVLNDRLSQVTDKLSHNGVTSL